MSTGTDKLWSTNRAAQATKLLEKKNVILFSVHPSSSLLWTQLKKQSSGSSRRSGKNGTVVAVDALMNHATDSLAN
jgi:hypothetical protein